MEWNVCIFALLSLKLCLSWGEATGDNFCPGETVDSLFPSNRVKAISVVYEILQLCQTLCVCYLSESSRVPWNHALFLFHKCGKEILSQFINCLQWISNSQPERILKSRSYSQITVTYNLKDIQWGLIHSSANVHHVPPGSGWSPHSEAGNHPSAHSSSFGGKCLSLRTITFGILPKSCRVWLFISWYHYI